VAALADEKAQLTRHLGLALLHVISDLMFWMYSNCFANPTR
jgi:hypothetical protein